MNFWLLNVMHILMYLHRLKITRYLFFNWRISRCTFWWGKTSIFLIFWKPQCCPNCLFLDLASLDLPHKPNFDQAFWIWTQTWTCTVIEWSIVTDLWQLYYYCRSQKLIIILPVTASTVIVQLQQISYYAPFNYCAGTIWVQSQVSWSKLGLCWRSELGNSKNKILEQQCGFQKIWTILLLYNGISAPKKIALSIWFNYDSDIIKAKIMNFWLLKVKYVFREFDLRDDFSLRVMILFIEIFVKTQ